MVRWNAHQPSVRDISTGRAFVTRVATRELWTAWWRRQTVPCRYWRPGHGVHASDIGDKLRSEGARSTGVVASSTRLPLGIGPLDRRLDGGLPAGSVVAYCAPPASQSELLLYELTAMRETLYLTTDRSEDAVADALRTATCPTGDPEIRFVPGDAPLENARRMIRGVGEGTNVIVDAGDALERTDRGRYERFLNELGNHVQNTAGLAFLHCLRSGSEPDNRTATEHMADVVFDLRQERHGTEVETRLGVPKFRGGRALSETVKLELEERVRVDTSRDIA